MEKKFWQDILERIKLKTNPESFNRWLSPLECLSFGDNKIVLKVPGEFYREWIIHNYLPLILNEIKLKTGRIYKVEFKIAESKKDINKEVAKPLTPIQRSNKIFDLSYTFDTFVVGPSNELAYTACRAVTESKCKYNPLFIHGGVGLGKTHLLNAIGNLLWVKGDYQNIFYLSFESFMNEFISDVRHNRMDQFRTKYRTYCDVLLIDDIQFIAKGSKNHTQEEFFHTFNSLYHSHKQIVLTSDRYPHEMKSLEERLISRFEWGLIANIQPPEVETRVAILNKKAEAMDIKLPQEIALFIAQRFKGNIRRLEGVLIRLYAASSLQKRKLSLELAEEIVNTMKDKETPFLHTSIEEVQKAVANYYNIDILDLKSPSRKRSISFPRQIAMFFCREYLRKSYLEIGRHFGGKTHFTVVNAHKKISQLLERKSSIRDTISAISEQLSS
jgi:chromosomal replication initiator protein